MVFVIILVGITIMYCLVPSHTKIWNLYNNGVWSQSLKSSTWLVNTKYGIDTHTVYTFKLQQVRNTGKYVWFVFFNMTTSHTKKSCKMRMLNVLTIYCMLH